MLSVLIPVYNCDVLKLVSDLERQCNDLNVAFEIICIDDNSNRLYSNKSLHDNENVVWISLNENKGRSIVRNLLVEKSKYDNLIFIDCDMGIVSSNFVKNYVQLSSTENVIVGGICYSDNPPIENAKRLHWVYGVNREAQLPEERRKHPYSSFMSGNFFIKKRLFKKISFDETIKGYGHEDTLFGIDLKNRGEVIKHINNPLEHLGIEDANVFIEKSKTAIINLSILIKSGKIDDSVKVYKYYKSLKKNFLLPLFVFFYQLNKNSWIRNLHSNKPNIIYFDFLKLGYLSDELSE